MVANLAVDEQRLRNIPLEKRIHKAEIIAVIEHIKTLESRFISDIATRRCCHLVENRQRVAHCSVGFLCNHIKSGILGCNSLTVSDVSQLVHNIGDMDSCEVIDLASREDSGQNLMLLGRCQDKNGVRRRLLERLEKRVESALRQHVHLIYDINAILPHRRRNAHLVGEFADIVNRVVRCRIEFHYIIRTPLIESAARFALATRLAILVEVGAVDSLRKNTRARGLSHATRTAEQIGVGEPTRADSRLERVGKRLLSHKSVESGRTIFPRRYYIFFHNKQF